MSNAEHLLENVIYAMKEGRDGFDELERHPNDVMLELTGFSPSDIVRMAAHVVYSLYDGHFPHDYLGWEIDEFIIEAAESVLVDNGIDEDEASTVLQALGYVLLGKELYPE